jgi:hypothetical protein
VIEAINGNSKDSRALYFIFCLFEFIAIRDARARKKLAEEYLFP